MKQWKRLAALSSAIVMAAATLTYFPNDTLQNIRLEISASAEDASAVTWTKTESDGLTWTLYEDGTLNISGTGEMRGYNAYSIKSPACDNSNIKNVVIEDGITSIGSFAFYGCSLTNIRIPGSVTSIGKYALDDCMSLTSVTIPGSVSSIGEYAFMDCRNLTDATILDGVTSIENRAFWGCSRLTSVTIPNSVTNIGESAFWHCKNLTSITIPDGVTSIEDHVFSCCYSLPSITIPNSVTSIGNRAFDSCTKLTSITIPDSVISIGNFAFEGCTELTSITIPDSVISIGDSAFEKCRILPSISIPDSVTSIGGNVFKDCNRLKTISLSCKSSLKKSDFGEQANLVSASHILKKTAAKAATCTESGNKEYWTCEHCGKYFLSDDANPETAKAVEQSEFIIPALNHKNAIIQNASEPTETAPGYSGDRYCPDCDTVLEKGYTYWKEDNLTWKLYEDGTLTISGTGTMKNYNDTDNPSPAYKNLNVKKVVIEDGVTSIGKYAFWYCKNLTSITIPDGVTSIGRAAFDNCHSLTSITIPESVTNIENYAFEWCSSLSNVTIPNSITSIGTGVFHRCISLTSITIPDSVTSIGESAFERCIGLSSVTIPDSVTSIGKYAFYACKSLTNITIPDSVTSIGESVFSDCNSLQTISLSCKSSLKKSNFGKQANLVSALHTLKKKEAKAATCTENGNKAYWTCEHCGKYFLSDDANPETAKAVEQSEFIIPALNHKNETIRDAVEPNGTKPGYSGDRYCPDCDTVLEKGYTYWNEGNLTWKLDADGTLTISGTGTMKDYDYNNNPSPANQKKGSVKKVVIKDGVTSIGNFAFYNCKSLTSITIPDSVTSIELAAFNNCNNLTSITIPDSVTSIGDSAFELCNKLSSITLSNNITSIGNWAFHGCHLTSITIPDSVTSIGAMAFYSCSNLQTISLSCKSSLKKSDFGDKADLVSYTNQHTLTKTAAKAATCSESGNKEYWTCEHCGKYFLSDDANPATATAVELSETVIPASHKLTKVEAKDATCTEDGNKAYWTCEHCGKYFLSDDTNPETAKAVEQAETVIPASHKLTKVEAKAATCTEDGNKEYWTCEHCKKYFLSDDTNPATAKAVELSETVIPASHKLTKVEAKDATCTEDGNKAYWTCEHCGKYFLSDDTNPETAKAVELSETVIPALVQIATTTTPIKCVYGQDMNKIDLRDYVKNTDVVGEVTVKVATGSTLPDGMKLDNGKISGKPAKAYEDGKEVTFTFTAENGNTANLTLLFLVAKADPTVEVAVSGDSHTEGDLVSELKLILSENSTKGVVELVSEIKALVAGKNTFTWKFTPEDENNYNMVTGTVVVNAQTTTTTTTTTKATTTTTKATTTTKPSKTTTTKATTTTKPNKTTTTKVTTTTKPNKTTTTKVTTTTKPSKTTTTNATTTTKPSKTTTTNATTTTKPSKTTTTKVTTTTKPNKTTTTKATTTTKPSKTTTTKATTTTKPSKTTTTKATTTTKPSKTTTTNATTTTKPSKTTTTKVTTTTKPSKATTTKVTTTTTTAIPSYGDVNLDGKVDIVDAIFLNKYLATLIQFSDAQVANADCYQDGVLNDQDTTALMQFIILLIDDLPVQPTEK
ncbi:MAG: leucine-rich repeat protein [Ruminococcus sp.]